MLLKGKIIGEKKKRKLVVTEPPFPIYSFTICSWFFLGYIVLPKQNSYKQRRLNWILNRSIKYYLNWRIQFGKNEKRIFQRIIAKPSGEEVTLVSIYYASKKYLLNPFVPFLRETTTAAFCCDSNSCWD